MESALQSPPQRNESTLVKFILIGFSDVPILKDFLLGVFLIIYVIILMGNSLIIIITKVDPSLQTPMYFFLGNFAFLEICYVSVTVPRLLTDLYRQDRSISFVACATQMYFFLVFGATECFILTAMAYDRYVAICNPLLYPLVMNSDLCIQLVVGCWTSGVPLHIGFTYWIFSLPFCGTNQLNHFFCDIPPVLTLACGDTFMIEMLIYMIALLVVTIPFILILVSYVKIVTTILKLPSATGRAKAFSTCSSHLMVVALFFGSGIITYLRPKSTHSAGTDKFLSLFYTVVTPTFNPMIYCLRNKDVMLALKKFLLRWIVL
ncbi:olfactory receptor 10AG1-like [Nannospalax galili]|uniref:olfactory receptor 10AG1-like n=1 Tax=Nannospalax galili TaxID=1026970 RepID=UPI0004ED1E91|nr:olfactory receptor 10AG1-like [Nannospalax galili]